MDKPPPVWNVVADTKTKEDTGMAEAELTRSGDVAILTLNRPDQLNAITTAMIGLIEDALDAVEQDDCVGLVITGDGRAFCAGSDLKEQPGNFQDRVRRMHRLVLRMLRHPKVIAAALNGLAYGGGLEIAMGCTFRVAAPGAKLSLPEVKLGVMPAYGGTQTLPRLVGQAAALELLLLGEPITAERGRELGLVTAIAEDPLAAAIELVRKASKFGQAAQQAMRRAVLEGMERPLEQGLDLEHRLIGQLAPDMAAVTDTFTSKIRGGGA